MSFRRFFLISMGIHIFIILIFAWTKNFNFSDFLAMSSVAMAANLQQVTTVPEDDDSSEPVKRRIKIQTNHPVKEDPAKQNFGFGEYSTIGAVQELPVPLDPIRPRYPERARQAGLEGLVVLEAYIDASGKVRRVEIIRSPDNEMSSSAVETLLGTRFIPARVNGKNHAVRMRVPLRFTLQ